MSKKGQAGGLRMPEATATQLCRLAFLVLGALPVLACIAWVVVERIPAVQEYRQRSWEQLLANQLGVSVELSRVELLSPSRYRLHGIALKHPETKVALATLPLATASYNSGQWIVRAEQAEILQPQSGQLWKVGHDWLLCRPDQLHRRVGVLISKLHVLGGVRDYEFTDVRLALAVNQGEPSLRVSFASVRTAGSHSGADSNLGQALQPAEIVVRREIDNGKLATWVHVFAPDLELPCALFSTQFSGLRKLGPDATFSGTLDSFVAEDRWAMWLGGREATQQASVLRNVDFALLTHGTAARIQGVGAVAINTAKVSERGLRELTGSLEIQSSTGHISSNFLRAACHFFQLQSNESVLQASSRADFPFDLLKLRFHVEPQQLWISGGDDGTMLVDRQSVLAWRDAAYEHATVPLERVAMLLHYLEANDPAMRLSIGSHNSAWGLAAAADRWLPLGGSVAVEAGDSDSGPSARMADRSH